MQKIKSKDLSRRTFLIPKSIIKKKVMDKIQIKEIPVCKTKCLYIKFIKNNTYVLIK